MPAKSLPETLHDAFWASQVGLTATEARPARLAFVAQLVQAAVHAGLFDIDGPTWTALLKVRDGLLAEAGLVPDPQGSGWGLMPEPQPVPELSPTGVAELL